MKLSELATEYQQQRPGIVLEEDQLTAVAVAAARFYAGYGDIASVSSSDRLPGAAGAGNPVPADPDPYPAIVQALPIKDLKLITKDTEVSTGEWAIMRPLFVLYVERENATLLEATRGLGVDVFGRSVSEVNADIAMQENEIIPSKTFMSVIFEVD